MALATIDPASRVGSGLMALSLAILTWAGIGLFVLIALEATVTVGVIVARSVHHLADPAVVLGLVASLGVTGAAVAGAIMVRRWTPGSRRWRATALAAGLSLVASVRIAVAFTFDAPVDRDMVAYDSLASQVLDDGRLFSERPMGYPYLLAGAYALFGRGALAGEVLNIAAAVIGGIALWLLVRNAYGERAANVALFLYAFWPAGALMTSVRLTETSYTMSVLFAVLAVAQQVRLRGHALVGLLLGLSQYFRPTSFFLIPAFLLGTLWPGSLRRRDTLIAAATILLAFIAVLLPVVEYNRQAHGELSVSTSAYAGWSLWVGTNQDHGGRWNAGDWEALFRLTEGPVWDDSKAAGSLGIRRIQEDPGGFALLAVDKFHTMWGSEAYGVDFAIASSAATLPGNTFLTLISQIFYAAVTVTAALALISRRKSMDRLTILIVAISLTVALLHVFVEVRDRYHAYLVPLFIALAAARLADVRGSLGSGHLTRGPST